MKSSKVTVTNCEKNSEPARHSSAFMRLCRLLFNYIVVFVFVFLNELVRNESVAFYVKLVLLVLILLNGLLYFKKSKIQRTDIIVILHTLYIVIITMVFGTSLLSLLSSIVIFPILYVYFDRFLKKGPDSIDIVYYCFLTYFVINVILHLIGDDPLSIGGKNQLSLFFIPLFYFATLHSHKKYGKLTLKTTMVIVIASIIVFIHRSGTGVVSIFLALLSFAFLKIKIPTRKLKITLLVIYAVFAITLVFIPMVSGGSFIDHFIEDVLGKDITMSGRGEIWQYAIERIKMNFFGYGYNNSIISDAFSSVNVSVCHNSFLEVLMIGGLPLFVLYLLLIKNTINNKKNDRFLNFSYFILFALAVNGLTESIPYYTGLWLIMLAIKNYSFEELRLGHGK